MKIKKYSPLDLEQALSAVKDGGMSIRGSSKHFSVPFKTLRDHVKGYSVSTKPGRKPVLPFETEKELKQAVTEMMELGHGISRDDLCDLAEETVNKGQLKGFQNGRPTNKWFQGFKKRNELVLRQPVNISVNRMSMETLQVKENFYGNLKKLYDSLIPQGLNASMIFNVDESGLCLVMKSGKVVCPKGSKSVRIRKGGERGENITVVACGNATGSVILPPTVIFKGKSINEDLMNGAVEGTVFAHSPKSFTDSELFLQWFERFKRAIPPQRPVVLLLDGHASHVTLNVIQSARNDDIHMFCFPPHTTHLYQPLDRGFFGPLKAAFRKHADSLLRKNKKKCLNRYDFCKVLTPAWYKAATPENMVSGFSASGVWPHNIDAVCLPCEKDIADQSQPMNHKDVHTDESMNSSVNTFDKENVSSQSQSNMNHACNTPSTSRAHDVRRPLMPIGNSITLHADRNLQQQGSTATSNEGETFGSGNHSSTPKVSPVVAAVRELLKPSEDSPSARSKRITKSRLLTSTEFVEEMAAKEREKEQKAAEKEREKEEREKKKAEKSRKIAQKKQKIKEKKRKNGKKTDAFQKSKKLRLAESEDSSVDEPDERSTHVEETVDLESDEESDICGTCGKSFQKDFNGEPWIQCTKCSSWYHEKCQALQNYVPGFICDDCCPISLLKNRAV